MRLAGGMALAALGMTLAGPASAQRDPVNTDRLLQRIDRLPSGGVNLIREFGLPDWNARVLAAAQRYWLEQGGQPGAAPGAITFRTQLPSGFSFDRYDLYQTRGRNGRPVWTGRRVHMRRVEVTDAASRTFPLDAVWSAYQRNSRGRAMPVFRQNLPRMLPDPERVARAVLVRIEITDEGRCPALRNWALRAQTTASLHPRGQTVPAPADRSPYVLAVSTAAGRPVIQGPQRSEAGIWGDGFRTETSNCWRLQSINNPNRR